MVMIVPVVMQRDAVEFAKRVAHFISWSRQPAVQWHALDSRSADIHTFALLDIPEVDRVDALGGVGYNGGFHVTDQSPLRGAEEGMRLDVRSTCSSSEPAVLVLDQKLSN